MTKWILFFVEKRYCEAAEKLHEHRRKANTMLLTPSLLVLKLLR